MEDYVITIPDLLGNQKYSFYCVLDGHGGSKISQFVSITYPKILKQKLQTFKNALSLKDILKTTIENVEN